MLLATHISHLIGSMKRAAGELRMQDIANWVNAGFARYADLCGRRGGQLAEALEVMHEEVGARNYYGGEIHSNVRIQIVRYAKEFVRLLTDGRNAAGDLDLMQLSTDLAQLKARGCPSIALVELLLACTSPFGVTIPDLLLDAIPVSDALSFLEGQPPSSRRRVSHNQFLLKQSPYYSNQAQSSDARVRHHLAFFYCLLQRFGHGHRTAADLLVMMDLVRRKTPPTAEYFRGQPRPIFTPSSVQRRVLRHFNATPGLQCNLQREILNYLTSSSCVEQQSLLGIY